MLEDKQTRLFVRPNWTEEEQEWSNIPLVPITAVLRNILVKTLLYIFRLSREKNNYIFPISCVSTHTHLICGS